MADIGNVQWVDINALKPYENNAKTHSDKQLDLIGKSIEEFGFISPCLIDENNVLIAGHGRVEASKRIGLKKVPCLNVKGMTENQKRAYVLADNKLTELGGWDKDLLQNELSVLDIEEFDIDLTGFTELDMESLGGSNEHTYGDERERTYNSVNLFEYDGQRSYKPYDIPTLKKCDVVPDDMIGFNYVLSNKKDFDGIGVHFFIDDYQFERVWNNPKKYIEKLSKYECVCTPDFSPYSDMPTAMKIWNVYRNRMVGQLFQDEGLNVIPTITWSDESTFDYVINGIEPGGTIAISTVSISKLKSDAVFRDLFQRGIDLTIERIKPSCIILYGSVDVDVDFHGVNVKKIKPHLFNK